jgi:hypothetical protein
MPTTRQWIECTASDAELKLIKSMIIDPSLITKANLAQFNYNYCSPLRRSQLTLEDDIIILKEPIVGGPLYTRLCMVLADLRNILFVAFHANPIGGHFDAPRTLHRIRLRYYWPHMYKYIVRMCNACPRCALSNPTKARALDLVYNFPLDAPFRVVFVDAYSTGKHTGFKGSDTYLLGIAG